MENGDDIMRRLIGKGLDDATAAKLAESLADGKGQIGFHTFGPMGQGDPIDENIRRAQIRERFEAVLAGKGMPPDEIEFFVKAAMAALTVKTGRVKIKVGRHVGEVVDAATLDEVVRTAHQDVLRTGRPVEGMSNVGLLVAATRDEVEVTSRQDMLDHCADQTAAILTAWDQGSKGRFATRQEVVDHCADQTAARLALWDKMAEGGI